MSWDRLLWGVEFVGQRGKPMLIGTSWMNPPPASHYIGEPTRPILFCTRAQAREWCNTKMREYAHRKDSLALWRFRPVRVREVVKKVA
jgi:hypothetical protein